MNSTTIHLSANSLSADYVNFYGPFLIKGTADVAFNLYDIQEDINPVTNIFGYFGDASEYEDVLNLHLEISTLDAIEIATSGKIRSIKQIFSHTYEKDQSTFVNYLTASFYLTYASQRRGIHNVAFVHVKDSYYDNIKQIHLNSTQILPVSTNDAIAVASNESGDVFHLYLSRTQLQSLSTTDVAATSGTIFSPRTIKNCFVLQAQQGGVLVPTLSA
jgi:hypothetical protein